MSMTGTFKFDPATETFVFHVDDQPAAVSWNRKTREFEAWKSDEKTGDPCRIHIQFGGLFRALLALYNELKRKEV